MNKAIFLDRDGVINHAIVKDGKPYPPISLKDFKIIDGVKESLDLLKASNFFLIIVSNQPDVARGIIPKKEVIVINSFLHKNLPIDEILTCYHDDSDFCECRKPKPGSLFNAAVQLNLDLKKCYMVGDRWRDIEAGRSAGCKTIFIDYNYKEKQPDFYDFRALNLIEAVKFILGDFDYEKD